MCCSSAWSHPTRVGDDGQADNRDPTCDPRPVARYQRDLKQRIREILSERGTVTKTQLFSEMRGAFPAAVDSHVAGESLEPLLKVSPRVDSSSGVEYRPELHPLDFEWYFTRECAEQVAHLLAGPRREILCLGAPTVCAALVANSSQKTRLLDRNPAVLQRFPILRKARSLHLDDIARAREIGCRADVIIFDAPWYFHDVLVWAAIATQLVKPSGVLAFSLFPPLVRPAATAERQRILEFVSSIGDVEIAEDALTYDTPLFEREALRAAGIEDPGNWRRGDLVFVKVKSTFSKHSDQSQPGKAAGSAWRTLVVSGQVIKIRVRRQGSSDGGEALSPVEGVPSFVYPTVSARDPRRNRIDLWTSRNRVARVGNLDLVTTLLSRMQHGVSLTSAMKDAGLAPAPCPTSRTIRERLREVLGDRA